jgi:uncharacterized protein YbjT (DUF2867 family)
MSSGFEVVTGAFGYTGAAIARRLVSEGRRVRTLTNHPDMSDPLAPKIEIAPLSFDDEQSLRKNLEGADVLYNTYWVRFEHGGETYRRAVANSEKLFRAAKAAGVRRIVHISITNPSLDSPLGYFSGKARVEKALRESGVSRAILRPAVVYGGRDILINNVAWFLRRFPLFAVPGGSESKLQPVYIEDLAELALKHAVGDRNEVLDAVGPEQFGFEELVRLIGKIVGSSARIFRANKTTLMAMMWLLNRITGDVVLTAEEIDGLKANLLVSSAPPTCPTRISDWLSENADVVGKKYASELERHFDGRGIEVRTAA